MLRRKDVLTTGEVARICHVAPRTVTKWFDSGQLRGYRIPGSKDRRIPVDQLLQFMHAHGIPTDELELSRDRILILDRDAVFADALKKHLGAEGYEVHIAQTGFEAGALASQIRPNIVLLDVNLPDVDVRGMRRFFQSSPELQSTLLIGIGIADGDRRAAGLKQQGLHGLLPKPFRMSEFEELVQILQSGTETVHT